METFLAVSVAVEALVIAWLAFRIHTLKDSGDFCSDEFDRVAADLTDLRGRVSLAEANFTELSKLHNSDMRGVDKCLKDVNDSIEKIRKFRPNGSGGTYETIRNTAERISNKRQEVSHAELVALAEGT